MRAFSNFTAFLNTRSSSEAADTGPPSAAQRVLEIAGAANGLLPLHEVVPLSQLEETAALEAVEGLRRAGAAEVVDLADGRRFLRLTPRGHQLLKAGASSAIDIRS
ncbi:hypothetical protein [Roseomonas sp. 18066]|uniref:hypothetical protein n=1 Tax=Roseomonas sp. 18066 TaxID=2681412 RepID=UPI00135B18E4|nr:hypothetical protein [Roseomonas sp. 18066]